MEQIILPAIGLLFFGIGLGMFLYTAMQMVYIKTRYLISRTPIIRKLYLSHQEKEKLDSFFTLHFSYYQLLTEKEKKEFIIRVIIFKKQNQLHTNANVKSSGDEIELMINAAFAQITFGYHDFYTLGLFNKIVIYPDSFYSRYLNSQVKGLTVGSGFIHYSWNDFKKGYMDEKDGINLGLHELAHALYIDRFHNMNDFYWEQWSSLAQIVLTTEQKNNSPFFRLYGRTNIGEFWAVTVEHFFEDPITFKTRYPDFYNQTAILLRQDMAQRKIQNNSN